MPARLMAFPFALDATGSVATVEQGGDPYIEQQIAVASLTIPGERILVPTFGCNDPAFRGFELSNLQRHLIDFGPDIEVAQLDTRQRTDDREEITITWQRRGDDAA